MDLDTFLEDIPKVGQVVRIIPDDNTVITDHPFRDSECNEKKLVQEGCSFELGFETFVIGREIHEINGSYFIRLLLGSRPSEYPYDDSFGTQSHLDFHNSNFTDRKWTFRPRPETKITPVIVKVVG